MNNKLEIDKNDKLCSIKTNGDLSQPIKTLLKVVKRPFVLLLLLFVGLKMIIKRTKNRELARSCTKLEEIEALGFRLNKCFNVTRYIYIEFVNNEYERYPLTCTITLRYLNKDFIEKYLKKWEMDVEEYLSSLLLQKRTEEKTNFINNDVEINGNKIELFQYQRNLISCCSKKNLIYYVCSAKSFIKRGDEYFQLDTGIARDKYSLTNNNIAIFKMILEKIRYNYITKEEVIKWLRGENKKI